MKVARKMTNEEFDALAQRDYARAIRINEERELSRPEREARDREYARQAKALKRELRTTKVDGSGPTPHALRQHRKTSMERMIEKKQLHPEMIQAAQEIERIYLALTGAVLIRSQGYERQDRSAGAPLAERTAVAYHLRYKPWADELSRRKKGCAWPMLEVVVDVVVDGRSFDTIDQEHGWSHGVAKFIVRWALLDYAERAGWAKAGSRRELESDHGLRRAPKNFFRAAA